MLGALFLNAAPLLNQESLLNYAHVIRRGRWMADAPEILHTRTVAVPAEQIHAFHVNPVPGSAVGLTATAIEVVAPATLAVPVVQTPAASALPPTLKVVPASGNWLVNAIVWAASARFAQKIAQVPEQSATSTRSIAILLIAATAVPALYAVTSGPFIASVRMS